MRLPHITIEYQEEESYALGRVSLSLIFGFGVHWAWIYLFMFNGGQLFYSSSANLQDALFLVSIALFSATLLCYGILLEKARSLFATARKRSRNRLVAAIMVFLGMVISVLGGVVSSAPWVVVVLSGVLCGVGSAVLLMSYAVSFSVCDLPTVAVCLAASLPLGAVGFALVVLMELALPGSGGLVCLALPFVECLCLTACSKQLVDNLEFSSLTIPVYTRPFALHICLPCAVFGFVMGLISVRAISFTLSEGVSDAMLAIAASGIVVGIVLVVALLTQRKSNNFAFRTLLPVVAALLVVLALVPSANEGSSASFILFGSYSMLSVCIWILCSDISQRFRISAFTAFGFGWGMMSVGTMVGVAASMPGGLMASFATDANKLVALAFVAITFGSSLLPNNSELRRALKRGAYCPALVGENDYAMDILREQNAAIEADSKPDAGFSADFTPGGLAQAVEKVAIEASEKEGGEADSAAKDVRTAPEAVARDDASKTVAPDQDIKAWDDSLDKKTLDAIAAVSAAEKGQPIDAISEESNHRAMGRFKRKCSAVADCYLLSRKETEVMFLLAKGYKSAQIQETLFISEGTANTHMRHIYRKLNVHSQRELMDMVDAEQVPEQDF